MGRNSTGAITTDNCLQLNITSLNPYLKKVSSKMEGTIAWSNGNKVGISIEWEKGRQFVHLKYSVTVKNEKKDINMKLLIYSIPSNLGKGKIFYFVCPFSNRNCRTLYMGYGSLYFKSLKSYQNRIYYKSQLSSYLDKHNDKYWRLKRRLEKLFIKHPKTHYKGQKTAIRQRLERLEIKLRYHDIMRWKILPKAVLKSMAAFGVEDGRDMF